MRTRGMSRSIRHSSWIMHLLECVFTLEGSLLNIIIGVGPILILDIFNFFLKLTID